MGSPFAFNSSVVDKALFGLAGCLLVLSVFHPTRGMRLAALGVCLVGALGRIAVLLTFDTSLPESRIIAGIAVWSLVTVLLVTVAVLSELLQQTEARKQIKEVFPDAEW